MAIDEVVRSRRAARLTSTGMASELVEGGLGKDHTLNEPQLPARARIGVAGIFEGLHQPGYDGACKSAQVDLARAARSKASVCQRRKFWRRHCPDPDSAAGLVQSAAPTTACR